MSAFGKSLISVLGEESVLSGEPMRNHTTFRIGGPVQWFVKPETAEQIVQVTDLCKAYDEPYYILGNGSNLLVSDGGWDGVVISTEKMDCFEISGETVVAQAGIMLSRLARRIEEASLTGFEFAAGIPGTLGGAVVMNAGAYGSEMKDVLTEATVMMPDGKIHSLKAEDLELGYRTSCIPREGYVVLEAKLRLQKGERQEISARIRELAELRKSKQPLEYPSAGSMFKRPVGHFAGKLVDDAGLRGFCVGGAQVSEKHCGFVVNKGNATATDVIELCEEVRRKVMAQFGVELEMEVKKLGF